MLHAFCFRAEGAFGLRQLGWKLRARSAALAAA